jgi:hypothetical protein
MVCVLLAENMQTYEVLLPASIRAALASSIGITICWALAVQVAVWLTWMWTAASGPAAAAACASCDPLQAPQMCPCHLLLQVCRGADRGAMQEDRNMVRIVARLNQWMGGSTKRHWRGAALGWQKSLLDHIVTVSCSASMWHGDCTSTPEEGTAFVGSA